MADAATDRLLSKGAQADPALHWQGPDRPLLLQIGCLPVTLGSCCGPGLLQSDSYGYSAVTLHTALQGPETIKSSLWHHPGSKGRLIAAKGLAASSWQWANWAKRSDDCSQQGA